MNDLETCKLSRGWTAINWIGESSSLTGTDAIAWYGLGAEDRKPKDRNWQNEDKAILDFYQRLSCVLENLPQDAKPEGKFLAPNEKLSIPELVKRLVTREDIARKIGMASLETGFTDIVRKPEVGQKGQWTGWFMGDGDEVGKELKEIAKAEGADGIKEFSEAMRNWGRYFEKQFDDEKLGRIIYAGGDDFLGVIYNSDSPPIQIKPPVALEWLMELRQEWEKHGQNVTVSVGFVWAAGSVPQRDVLQHCREAEKLAKSQGRDRVTIRVVFNSGQYVQWICPWDDLHILKGYRDRDGKTWEQQPNWSHIYNDFAQLKARHAFGLNDDNQIDIKHNEIIENRSAALDFLEIYFEDKDIKNYLKQNEKRIVEYAGDASQRARAMIGWICDLINVAWHLCSNT